MSIRNFLKKHAQKRIDFFSGLTVSLALVPEAIAFSFVAGVDPLIGLYAAFVLCFVTACMGGRPGMISGATGSMAVVMTSLVASYGVQYLFATIILTGCLQLIFGALKCGKLAKMLPQPVMLGFVNGLAIVIFISQLSAFKVKSISGALIWMSNPKLSVMLALVLITMAIIHYLPKITRAIAAS